MKIFLIDVTREEGSRYAEVSVMSLELGDGKYRFFKRFTESSFSETAKVLVMEVLKSRPDKVIVDSTGIGVGMAEFLVKSMEDIGLNMLPDGTIVY